jgi:hypothetical protein
VRPHPVVVLQAQAERVQVVRGQRRLPARLALLQHNPRSNGRPRPGAIKVAHPSLLKRAAAAIALREIAKAEGAAAAASIQICRLKTVASAWKSDSPR